MQVLSRYHGSGHQKEISQKAVESYLDRGQGLETFTLRKNFLPTLRSTFYDILWYAVSKIEESQANFKRILIGKVQFFRRPQNVEKSPNVFYITISQFKKHFSTFYDFPRISELTRL